MKSFKKIIDAIALTIQLKMYFMHKKGWIELIVAYISRYNKVKYVLCLN